MVRVSGVVLDRYSGDPIPGALIHLGPYRTTSRSDGTFEFDVPEGTYILTASAEGYSQITRVVDVVEGTYLTVLMTPIVTLL
ncbi:MAG: carboxypeptidase-like regulatory domain-containing protein [archaeon GB-1867-035]|nr:carboxypeptidase-like regulatory domain-containing protein [Candidatus Culexmicrobium profundum]